MLECDEAALVCDLAETYHIYNWRELPLTTVAALSSGLRDDSRIKMKMAGSKLTLEQMLMASILDQLKFLSWAQTDDARHGINRPESTLAALLGNQKNDDHVAFESVDDFKSAWERLTQDGN